MELGIRVQMIRRPGRARWATYAGSSPAGPRAASPGCGSVRCPRPSPALTERDLKELAAGITPSFGSPAGEPVFLVCTHGRRSTCCARFGAPLAQALAARHPGQVWETTHVGGHRFAANLVILPHGLYYGPVGLDAATAAISAYQRGAVAPGRYRGRAGQPKPTQEAEHALLTRTGSLALAALAYSRAAGLRSEREAGSADRPLCRFVQRRACARPASSAKITSPAAGCSVSPPNVR